ncbi:MAG: O-antigen ligase family protein [Cryomorphaceae bacterium]|nr:O-antigen ligase family protein [Cryomorphaceae bacterium]
MLILSTLLPTFGAIDNNSIRWLFISLVSSSYILRLLLNKEKVHYNSIINTILFIVILYIGFSILNADNINEGIISAYKILITISVFFLSIIAFKKIENPVLFLAQLLSFFLLLESLYLIIDYNISRSFIKGIAQNPNISSSSILFKLIFFLYLKNNYNYSKFKFLIWIIEIIAIISIIILQSRLGLLSLIFIYFSIFMTQKLIRKKTIFSFLIILTSFIYFSNTTNSNILSYNFSEDESSIQRIEFYNNAIDLIKQKPLFGFGLGSWKYESLSYSSLKNERILVPYYTHNDFLQIFVEMGILGFIIYLSYFIKIGFEIFKKFKLDSFYFYFGIVLVVFFGNTMLNFPVHRSQEIIPFMIFSALILSISNIKLLWNKKNPLFIYFLLILLIPSSAIAYQEHKSLIIQGQLLSDYEKGYYSIKRNTLDKINFKLPNLSANTAPISSYLSRYYFELGDKDKAQELLEYSVLANKNDLLTKELMLRNYIFLNRDEEAFKIAEELIFLYPNNETYGNFYFLYISKLKKYDELYMNPIIYLSNNLKIHLSFYSTLREEETLNNNDINKLVKHSQSIFPNKKF